MHSFIIIAKNQDKRREYIANFCQEQGIGKFDQNTSEPLENSFGIEQVRNMQKVAYRKPMQGKSKALILEDAEKLTTEAQNALLKLLEEPPQHTFVFLSCTTDANFLPTILSRCKKIVLEEVKEAMSENAIFQYTSILESLMSSSISQKLALAEKIAGDKDTLSNTVRGFILFLREKMLEETDNTSFPRLLNALQKAFQQIQSTNVSPRMILEHYFLNAIS